MHVDAVLVLWDVDNTLIVNGGVSKENYTLAFQILTGTTPTSPPKTGGRTDRLIMSDLLKANGHDPARIAWDTQEAALSEAGRRNAGELARRGSALPGAAAALNALAGADHVVQSVLTGNIEANARVKLATFSLDNTLDFTIGAFGSDSRVRADLVPVAQDRAAVKYGFAAHRSATVLIGDTVLDVEAGIKGGARVIGVATGGDSVVVLRQAGADDVMDDLTDSARLMSAVELCRRKGPVLRGSQSVGS